MKCRFFAVFSLVLLSTLAYAGIPPIPESMLKEAKERKSPHGADCMQLEMNESIEAWVTRFSTWDRERFERFMTRGSVYQALIEDTLVKHGLPSDLYYLAMIESGFVIDATSRVRAKGIWQFTQGTGRRFGLRIDSQVDERLDPIRATEAAARYLKDLYDEFGSWYLAMAAYNAGEGKVRQAIRLGGTRDYWALTEGGYLPSETSAYVPIFQAAMRIAKSPESYGFTSKPIFDYPKVKQVRLARRQTLKSIAIQKGLSYAALRSVNPQVLRGRARPGYRIWVPVQTLLVKRDN
jgi:membrane-bound lytic murein transglycosylase D